MRSELKNASLSVIGSALTKAGSRMTTMTIKRRNLVCDHGTLYAAADEQSGQRQLLKCKAFISIAVLKKNRCIASVIIL